MRSLLHVYIIENTDSVVISGPQGSIFLIYNDLLLTITVYEFMSEINDDDDDYNNNYYSFLFLSLLHILH